MKQTIRCNTFETNSSSNHSVVLTRRAHLPNLDELSYNVVISHMHDINKGYDFEGHGTTWRGIENQEYRLNYLYRYAIGWLYNKRWAMRHLRGSWNEEFEAQWKKYLATKRRFQKMFPNCTFSERFYREDGTLQNNIDHQSLDSPIMECILGDETLIRWFLSDAGILRCYWEGEDDDFTKIGIPPEDIYVYGNTYNVTLGDEGYDITWSIKSKYYDKGRPGC